MSYKSLILDPATPPRVRQIIERVERLRFNDVHSMLRLPIGNYGLRAGCNFAITDVLTAVIAGASTVLYEQKTSHVGERFKGVLEDYFPWDLEPKTSVPPAAGAAAIYHVFRNPLTHDCGLDLKKQAKGFKVIVKRLGTEPSSRGARGLTERLIEKLETYRKRPTNISATVRIEGQRKVLLVEGLYWGVRRMIERLSADRQRMLAADQFLSKL